MPPGPGWIGRWSTNAGTVELVPAADRTGAYPIAGGYELRRGDASVTGTLGCNQPSGNRLYCAWVEGGRTGPMVLVMNPDGVSFVANWGSPDGTARLQGQRAQP